MVVGQLGRKIAWNFLLTRSSAISQVPVLGILDKMPKSAFDHGRPLTAISISPPERSAHNEGITSEYQYRTTYGSIMDNQRIAEDPVEDSISGYRHLYLRPTSRSSARTPKATTLVIDLFRAPVSPVQDNTTIDYD